MIFTDEIATLITDYCSTYELRSWIDYSKLCLSGLSENEAAIDLLERNPNIIDWPHMSRNRRGVSLLRQFPGRVDWVVASANHELGPFRADYIARVNWRFGSSNPALAGHLINDPSRVDWRRIALNHDPRAVRLIIENLDRVDHGLLSSNPGMVDLLIAHPNWVDPWRLIDNPRLVEVLDGIGRSGHTAWLARHSNIFEHALRRIRTGAESPRDGRALSANRSARAMDILRDRPDLIQWPVLSKNPAIFTLVEPEGLKRLLCRAPILLKVRRSSALYLPIARLILNVKDAPRGILGNQ